MLTFVPETPQERDSFAAAIGDKLQRDASNAPELFEVNTPPTPWPDDCMPYGMAEAAQAIAEHAKAPLALAGMAVVAAVAHIAQRLVDARHPKTGPIPASLYTLTEGGSGARKSECFKLATKPIAERERTQREAHKAKVQALENEAAQAPKKDRDSIMSRTPADPRTIFIDATTQKIESVFINGSAPGLSLSTDEGGTLFGGHSLKAETKAASLSALTRLFDGSGVDRGRVGEGQSGFRFGIRFGVFLSAQPIVLREALGDPLMRGQGFLPRFLYAAPASLAGTRFLNADDLTKQAKEDPRIERYWGALERMDALPLNLDEHGGLKLPTVGMDAGAVSVWIKFYNDTETRQGVDGDLYELNAFASRAGELAARISAVFAAWRTYGSNAEGEATVTTQDMRQAVALVEYSLAEWKRQGAGAILSQTERDARYLLDWLHRKAMESVTRSQIAQGLNALRKNKSRRDAAIDELLRRRWLTETGAGFEVAKNSVSCVATAIPAIPATFERRDTAENSESSRNSDSTPAAVFFSLEPPRYPPADPVVQTESPTGRFDALPIPSHQTGKINAPQDTLQSRIYAMAKRRDYSGDELALALEGARSDPAGWLSVVQLDEGGER